MSSRLPDLPGLTGMNWSDFAPGEVWLCGAGPGDPGLLTLRALHALGQADVVVHDALVDLRVLALAPQAAIVHAGKRGGKPSPKQADITLRLVALARQGKRVLRLKGGDPFVFGRGGEEAAALARAGIVVRVIPGISAGIGGLGLAGLPVTHRDTNHAVTFLTGHDQAGEAPSALNWQAISEGAPIIVIYMAMKHLATIAARLLAAGRRPGEPVFIVTEASLPGQRVLETTLGSCAREAAEAGLQPPAIICVGPVKRLEIG